MLKTCFKLFRETVCGSLTPCLPLPTEILPVAYSSHACHMPCGLRVTALHSNYISPQRGKTSKKLSREGDDRNIMGLVLAVSFKIFRLQFPLSSIRVATFHTG